MFERKKLLAICGSTRSKSSNLNFIQAVASLAAENLQFDIPGGLAALPHFNPDLSALQKGGNYFMADHY